MAQLFFRYSAMNSGKSLELLKVAHNYEEQGKRVWLFTPSIDDRYGVGKITTRLGLQREAMPTEKLFNINELLMKERPYCILIDEGQFLTKDEVMCLTVLVDEYDIPVIVYGLKNDFRNNLFEGSQYLLIYADKIEEIKTVCWYCNRKAIMNLRIDENGNGVYEGKQIEIGGNDRYRPVCRKHYYSPIKNKEGDIYKE
ncbi:thymidine kinase [Petroclostridium sp. X23]|uniref:thymidine kinase n=1 Tax=Petroclostridium sp. X23 TaxID=3045146 RepID=UPI0024AD725F|nr:thymidine kinase [Petroclostridium sp. X23]WHH59241.1 thymidine kinase [Petroclostridium sp. X23]